MGVGRLTKEQKEISYNIRRLQQRQKYYYNKWHEMDMLINILKNKK